MGDSTVETSSGGSEFWRRLLDYALMGGNLALGFLPGNVQRIAGLAVGTIQELDQQLDAEATRRGQTKEALLAELRAGLPADIADARKQLDRIKNDPRP